MLFIHLSFCFFMRFKSSWRKNQRVPAVLFYALGRPLAGGEAGNAHFKFHSLTHFSYIQNDFVHACFPLPHSHSFNYLFVLFSLHMQLLAAVWCRCIAVPACQPVLFSLLLWGDLQWYSNNAQRCGHIRSFSLCMITMMILWVAENISWTEIWNWDKRIKGDR